MQQQRQKVRIPIKKSGDLTRHGYAAKLPAAQRRVALAAAVRVLGRTPVIRKLNALAIVNKNRSPRLAAIFRRDMAWVQKHGGHMASMTSPAISSSDRKTTSASSAASASARSSTPCAKRASSCARRTSALTSTSAYR